MRPAAVYGRLSQNDVNSLMSGVPFVDQTNQEETREQWRRLAVFVNRPYVFDDAELPTRKREAPPSEPPPRLTRRQALEYAETGGIGLRDVIKRMVSEELSARP